jgi:uncharacterized membrane protein YdfJ with MMPL/SSD domain
VNLLERIMRDNHPGRVEDYTGANLVLILVNLLWIFVWIWSVRGLGAVVLLAIALNHGITLIARARRRRLARDRKRGVRAS